MKRSRFTEDQIIGILKEYEAGFSSRTSSKTARTAALAEWRGLLAA